MLAIVAAHTKFQELRNIINNLENLSWNGDLSLWIVRRYFLLMAPSFRRGFCPGGNSLIWKWRCSSWDPVGSSWSLKANYVHHALISKSISSCNDSWVCWHVEIMTKCLSKKHPCKELAWYRLHAGVTSWIFVWMCNTWVLRLWVLTNPPPGDQ